MEREALSELRAAENCAPPKIARRRIARRRIAPNSARTERIVWKMVSSVGISRFAFFSCCGTGSAYSGLFSSEK